MDFGSNDVAIVGMSCRYSGCENIEDLWKKTLSAEECIDRFPPLSPTESDRVFARGLLKDSDCFDADFFGIAPKEAKLIDPQHRILLECAWNALQDAGVSDDEMGDDRIGVYCGSSLSTYLLNQILPNRENLNEYFAYLGNQADLLSLRLANRLNCKGPAVTVQTACSTSLVAVHLACQSLRLAECELALAGGVSIKTDGRSGYRYEQNGIHSESGSCRPFDKAADGTVFSDGVGVVILKLLERAVEDGDRIYAVIRGSAVNNDGSDKVGITAPSLRGQRTLIEEALTDAQLKPEDVGYIETHGTGTAIGDPIEIAALKDVYQSVPPKSCAIGGVKANLGHTDAAAGVTGLIKAALVVYHKVIPPIANFSRLSPKIDEQDLPFRFPVEAAAWDDSGRKRNAAISSFGVGGTNAHVLISQWEDSEKRTEDVGEGVFYVPLSAKSPERLFKIVDQLRQFLEHTTVSARDLTYTLARRRRHLSTRTVFVAPSLLDLITQLSNWSEQCCGTIVGEPAGPLQTVLEHWVGGERDSLSELPTNEGRLISLPDYPFARVRHWVDSGATTPMKGKSSELVWRMGWNRVRVLKDEPPVVRGRKAWLTFVPSEALGGELRKHLEAVGQTVTTVIPSGSYERVNKNLYAMRFGDPEDSAQLLRDLRAYMRLPQKIIYIAPESSSQNNHRSLTAFAPLLMLWQSMSRLSISLDIDLNLVTCGVHDILGSEALEPDCSLATGVARAMSLESSEQDVSFKTVAITDLDRSDLGPSLNPMIAQEIIRGCLRAKPFSECAIRMGSCWERSATEYVRQADEDASAVLAGGNHLVLGASGGIGQAIASMLSEAGASSLTLTYNTTLLPEKLHQNLQGSKTKVSSLQCDITSEEGLRRAIESASSVDGSIDTIWDCSGVGSGALATYRKLEDAEQVLRVRFLGAKNLKRALSVTKVGSVVLFSSLSSLRGVVGQVDYMSANAFIDSFSQILRRELESEVFVINSDTWGEVGMAVKLLPQTEEAQALLRDSLSTNDAIAAVRKVISSQAGQYVISRTSPLAPGVKLDALTARTKADKLSRSSVGSIREFKKPTSELEIALHTIWAEALETSDFGIEDDFFDLGGHSLLAMEIHSKISERYQVDLPFDLVMDATTIKSLSVELEKELIKQLTV